MVGLVIALVWLAHCCMIATTSLTLHVVSKVVSCCVARRDLVEAEASPPLDAHGRIDAGLVVSPHGLE